MNNEQKREIIKALAYGKTPEEIAAAEEACAPVASLQMETGDGFTLESILGTEGLDEGVNPGG